MKKLLSIIAIILLIGCFVSISWAARFEVKEKATLDQSQDDSKTSAVFVPWNAIYLGVFIPDLDDNSTVGIEVFQHDGNLDVDNDGKVDGISTSELVSNVDTNWVPVVDISDGQDAVICASTYDPCYVDITVFVAGCRGHYIRLTCASAQSADEEFWVVIGSSAH